MKYLVASVILLFCTLQTFCQQDYFIYLQSDNNQAFYLRINNSVYSAAASGYLILPKLPDSTANITIGFAKAVFPEQQFNIPVNHKDAGYLLKNFGDRGWGLFNLQTMAVIMNSNAAQEKRSPEISGIRKNDAFSLLLANAVNDTAVLYVANKPVKVLPPEPIAAPEKKKDSTDAVASLPAGRDTATLVTKKPAAIDSNLSAKHTVAPRIDSSLNRRDKPAAAKTAASNKKAAADSAALAKSNGSKTGKQETLQPAKDSAANTVSPATTPAGTVVAIAKPARKDTIIMMSEKPAENPKITAEKERKLAAALRKDSLQLAKKQAVKNNGPGQKPAVALSDSVKKDTLVSLGRPSPTKKDSAALAKAPLPPATVTKKEVVKEEAPPQRTKPAVYKAADLLTDTSYVAVFVDESKEQFDTIRVSIAINEAANKKDKLPAKETPAREKVVAAKKVIDSLNNPAVKQGDTMRDTAEKEKLASTKKPATVITPVLPDSPAVKQPPKDSLPVIVKTNNPAATAADSVKSAKSSTAPLFLNSDCKETALDTDIDKLRIKMLLLTSDEEKIGLARRLFRQKCFLTVQVKALSELFKTDEGKYKWFDAVYAFVADSGNFSKLSELLKDEYYLNRFKAMLRN